MPRCFHCRRAVSYTHSEAKVEELEIYKLELMEEYINQSVAMCESEMAAFFRGEERERPENYYVNII